MSLLLNAFDLSTNKDEMCIKRKQFSPNTIHALRDDFIEWGFKKDADYIYAWPRIESFKSSPPGNFKEFIIKKNEDTLVFNSILEDVIVGYFKQRNNKYFIRKNKFAAHWEVRSSKCKLNILGLKAYQVLSFHIQPCYSVISESRIAKLFVLLSQQYFFETNDDQLRKLKIDIQRFKRNMKGAIIGSRDNIKYFVDTLNKTDEFNKYVSRTSSDTYLYDEVKKLHQFFDEELFKNSWFPDGIKITKCDWNFIPDNNFEEQILPKAIYHFYNDRTDAGGAYQERIKALKPATFDQFYQKDINSLVICPIEAKGSLETFMKKISSIMKETFHIPKFSYNILTFDQRQTNYLEAIENTDYYNYQIGIVAFQNKEKSSIEKDSNYLKTKVKFLNQRIPTQDVIIENVRKDDSAIINTIALNLYSKLGGVAWTIAQTTQQQEIIIGISSFLNEDDTKIMGYTNIFDYNGKYLIGDCCKISTIDNYKKNLEEYLVNALSIIIKEKKIMEGTPVRLIFHLTKEASKKYEIDAIDSALIKFNKNKIEYSILHLSYGHNLRIIKDEGKQQVSRGTYVQLSTLQALMHLGYRSRIPVLIRLDKRSTYRDLYELCKQVQLFAHLCYRNYQPAIEPVTIKYPALMLKMISKLEQIPDWDKAITYTIKDQLWFI